MCNTVNINYYVTSHLPCCQWRMTFLFKVYEVSYYKSQARECLLFPSQTLGSESILVIEFYSPFPIVPQITFSPEVYNETHCCLVLWHEVEWASPKWNFLYCKGFTSSLSNTSNTAACMPNTCFIVNLVFSNHISLFKLVCLSDKAIANLLRLWFVCLFWFA